MRYLSVEIEEPSDHASFSSPNGLSAHRSDACRTRCRTPSIPKLQVGTLVPPEAMRLSCPHPPDSINTPFSVTSSPPLEPRARAHDRDALVHDPLAHAQVAMDPFLQLLAFRDFLGLQTRAVFPREDAGQGLAAGIQDDLNRWALEGGVREAGRALNAGEADGDYRA